MHHHHGSLDQGAPLLQAIGLTLTLALTLPLPLTLTLPLTPDPDPNPNQGASLVQAIGARGAAHRRLPLDLPLHLPLHLALIPERKRSRSPRTPNP